MISSFGRDRVVSCFSSELRFETALGHQMQIERSPPIHARVSPKFVRVHLFVATLGYSRRLPSIPSNQSAWRSRSEDGYASRRTAPLRHRPGHEQLLGFPGG